MLVKRYELPDEAWALVADLVERPYRIGRPRRDDRTLLNAIFWILCSGAPWRDLPERFGPWSSAYQRFRDWRDDGTFERILARLQLELNAQGLIDPDTWLIDSTVIRATKAATEGGKKGGRTSRKTTRSGAAEAALARRSTS